MVESTSSRDKDRGESLWRLPRFSLLSTLVVILVLANIACGTLIWTQWRIYNDELFGANAKYSTAKIYRHSYSTDSYDFLLSLQRLESKCALYASHRIDKDEFSLHRREIIGHYTNFLMDTDMGRTMRSYEDFNRANEEVTKFLKAATDLESNHIKPEDVFDISGSAIDAWALLRQGVYTSEYETRKQLEEGSRVAFASVQRTLQWLLILFVFLIVSSSITLYLAYRVLQSEKKRISSLEYIISTLSHDLRSPLQSVQNAAQLLLNRNDPIERKRYFGVIKTAVASVSKLIDDIAQVVNGASLKSRNRTVKISQWFDDFKNLYEVKARNKGLGYITGIYGDLDMVNIDPDRLNQCVGNLVDNAIQYTRSGSITISLDASTDKKDRGLGVLHFTVADTGPGMTKDEQKKMFKPFARGKNSSSINETGMGLGLSIFRNLTKTFGGTYEVTSEVGVGTTFGLRIPVTTEITEDDPVTEYPALETTTIKPPKNSNVRELEILIVDDDPTICKTTAEMLDDIGYGTSVAFSGREALQLLKSGRIGLVITDINMPEMRGNELAREIRSQYSKPPYLISMSAKRHDFDTADFRGLFDAMLDKPIEMSSLLDAIEQYESR